MEPSPSKLNTLTGVVDNSNPTQIVWAEATHPYVATDPKQLSLNRFERLKILQQHESGWWIGENEKGDMGIFPYNYVKILDNPVATPRGRLIPVTSTIPQIKINKPKEYKPELAGKNPAMEKMKQEFGLDDDDLDDSEEEEEEALDSASETTATSSLMSSLGLEDQQVKALRVQLEQAEKAKSEALEQKTQAEQLAETEKKQASLLKRQGAMMQNEIKKLKGEKQILMTHIDEYRQQLGLKKIDIPSVSPITPRNTIGLTPRGGVGTSMEFAVPSVNEEEFQMYKKQAEEFMKQIRKMDEDRQQQTKAMKELEKTKADLANQVATLTQQLKQAAQAVQAAQAQATQATQAAQTAQAQAAQAAQAVQLTPTAQVTQPTVSATPATPSTPVTPATPVSLEVPSPSPRTNPTNVSPAPSPSPSPRPSPRSAEKTSPNPSPSPSPRQAQSSTGSEPEKDALKKQLDQYKLAIKQLHREKEEKAKLAATLEKDKVILEKDKSTLEGIKASLEKEKAILEKERDDLKNANVSMKSQHESSSQASGEVKNQLESLIKERDLLVQERTALTKDRENLTVERDALKKEASEAKTQVESLSQNSVAEKGKLLEEVTSFKQKYEQSDKEFKDLKRKVGAAIKQYEKEITTLKTTLSEKEAAHKANIEQLQKQSEGTKGQLQKLKLIRSKAKAMKSSQQQLKQDVSESLKSFTKEMKSFSDTGLVPLTAHLLDVFDKYKKEMKERKDLFNQIQEMKGNIRVYVRVRPLMSHESTQNCIDCLNETNEVKIFDDEHKKYMNFDFDRVFAPQSTQQEVFTDVKPLATSILDGYNVCIFAYGQTGSGKTFTMEGSETDRGVNYRTITELFDMKKQREGDFSFDIKVAVMEIYNETLIDLLSPTKNKLEIMMTGAVSIPNLTTIGVDSPEDVIKTLKRGYKNRAVGSNNLNEHSSRSHCLVSVYVEGVNNTTGVKWKGKLHLIDLAGSERLKRTVGGASAERVKESVNINKSLSALGNVIQALSQKSKHVPYRDSKLTSLLQDSLGGNSKCLMFVNVSPAQENASESICSLQFASRVRKVELGETKKNIVK